MEGNGSTNQLGLASSPSTLSMNCDMCKICHSEAYKDDLLISPCYCSGSLLYVHQGCIQKWIKVTGANSCELCQYDFDVDSTTCPIRKWKRLELSSEERRKIVCSVTFHVVAVLCIVWSLWVLIDRTVAEVHSGNLKWPFWTKLVVVAIGFIGGVVFMYVQCKVYVHLFERLKAYNRVLFVRDVPQQARDQYKVKALENTLSSHIV